MNLVVRSSLVVSILLSLGTTVGCAATSSEEGDAQADELRQSDLSHDLAQPGGWVGTPFQGQRTREVDAALARDLKSLTERCVQHRQTPSAILPTKNLCPTEIFDFVRDAAKVTERATLKVGRTAYTAVIWDNESSDGGDAQDLAIYNANGKRLGVYRALFSRNDTVLDAMAHAFADHVQEAEMSEDEYADAVLVDVTKDVQAACKEATSDRADCTFAASLFKASPAQWESSSALAGGPKLLRSEAEMKDAIGRCLFTLFAYTEPTAAERAKASELLWSKLGNRDGRLWIYEAKQSWEPGLDAVSTEILASSAVAQPSCSLVFKLQPSSHFVEMSSDVQD